MDTKIKYYLVYWTNSEGRDYKEFSSKAKAEWFAQNKKFDGATNIFIDAFNKENDLLDYKQIKEKATSPEVA